MMKPPMKGQRKSKQAAIVDAAAELFVLHGYDGASTEMIAEKAGVSRQTIYNQFESKEALFRAIADGLVRETIAPLGEVVEQEASLREALLVFGRRMLTMMLRPRTRGLLRLVVMEAPRFPELGRAVYEMAMPMMESALASFLKERPELRLAEPRVAARQFLALTVHPIEFKAQLGLCVNVDDPEVTQHLEAAVDTFLRAFDGRAR